MEVNVLNIKGEDTGRKVTLNESIFGIEPLRIVLTKNLVYHGLSNSTT